MQKPTQPKKKWEAPQLYILDSPNAKNHPNVHEGTAVSKGAGKWFGSKNGSGTVASNKSSLVS